MMQHYCSSSRVDVPFETFVQVGPGSRSHLEGLIFAWTITPAIMYGFQYRFAQLFSMSRCAI